MAELLDISVNCAVTVSEKLSAAQKQILMDSLEAIRGAGHAVVRDFCILGQRLKELRDGGFWRYVLDANGERYSFDSFYDFCEDVFGFSKTKAQNMISLSSFVRFKDGDKKEIEFISADYENFNTSQLIELSSEPTYKHRLYTSRMTVQDMRLIKKYTRSRYVPAWTPESVLAEARADAEKKQELNARIENENKAVESTFTADQGEIVKNQIMEYLALWPFCGEARKEIISLYKKAPNSFARNLLINVTRGSHFAYSTPVGSVQASWWCFNGDDEAKSIKFTVQNPMVTTSQSYDAEQIARWLGTLIVERKYGLPEEYKESVEETPVLDELNEPALVEELPADGAISAVSEDAEAPSVPTGQRGYFKEWNFNTRAGRRAFINDYEKWEKRPFCSDHLYFKDMYSIRIRPLEIEINAVVVRRLFNVTGSNCTEDVLYFIKAPSLQDYTLITKEQLEDFLSRRVYNL